MTDRVLGEQQEYYDRASGDLHTRRLADRREFTIVKAFRTRADLQAAFADAGLTAEVRETPSLFQYAAG